MSELTALSPIRDKDEVRLVVAGQIGGWVDIAVTRRAEGLPKGSSITTRGRNQS